MNDYIQEITIQLVEELAYKAACDRSKDEPMPDFIERTPGVLESCISQPFQTSFGEELYKGIANKTAAMFYFMIKNHPFLNGNKRMAIYTILLFLFVNGKWLSIHDTKLYEISISVASKPQSEKEDLINILTQLFESTIIPLGEHLKE